MLDDRTCPVCQYMNGKTFDVEDQFSRTVQQLSAGDPQALKDLAPWPSQSAAGLQDLYGMSLGELQGGGYGAPPYHPGCRGMLSLAGDVDEEIPLGGPPEEAEEAAPSEAEEDNDALTSLTIPADEADETDARGEDLGPRRDRPAGLGSLQRHRP